MLASKVFSLAAMAEVLRFVEAKHPPFRVLSH